MERDFDWNRLFAMRLERLWTDYTNELLSRVRRIQEDGLENILRSILSPSGQSRGAAKLDPETAYERVQSFFAHRGSKRAPESRAKFTGQYKRDSHLRSVVSDIDNVEQRIERAVASRDKLKRLISKMFTGKKEVVFDDRGLSVKTEGGESIGLASLSSGEKHVLWIFIECLLADQNSFLIDEPELSLHVDWQRLLISAMSQLNPKAQLILATHSPEVMAELPDSKIFSL